MFIYYFLLCSLLTVPFSEAAARSLKLPRLSSNGLTDTEKQHFSVSHMACFLSCGPYPSVKTWPLGRSSRHKDYFAVNQSNEFLICLAINSVDFNINHTYNKILKSDWLSTTLISALIGQLNRTVRIMPK